MFCYQCEQTQKSNCHTELGVCGKDEKTALYQDLLVYASKGLAKYSTRLDKMNRGSREYGIALMEALFTTVTNVNFDAEKVKKNCEKIFDLKEKAANDYFKACKEYGIEAEKMNGPAKFTYVENDEIMLALAKDIGIEKRMNNDGKAITGLEELILYGLKGMAAYMDHAHILGSESDEVYSFISSTLDFLTESHEAGDLLNKALEVGKYNFDVMELLDSAHTGTFGNPEPTKVRVTPVKGKAILISGHDLKDLKKLLEQTEGKGINVYTHGEMLPAHGYPELKKHTHLVGNYGGAWQDQAKEFDAFPGAILMTTNCIQKPKENYKDRIFTCGLVAWEGVRHIENYDFSPVIEKALECDGFAADEPEHYTMTGFGHNAVLGSADKVIDLVKRGKLNHFYLVGGCDGAKSGRNYYTEFAEKAPKDSLILTLACGKFRFNKLEFGDIEGLPRMLDVGQCNDAYSAIVIAKALAEAFDTEINDLPLTMILSWYEQKAVAILLTLLYLGIKNIKLGPSLPAFLEPEVLEILVDKFQIAPIASVEEDMA